MDAGQLDSYLRIQISSDKLSAFVTFHRLTDEFEMSTQEFRQFLESKGVTYGYKDAVIDTICQTPLAFYKGQTLVAKGKDPESGKNGYVRYCVEVENSNHTPPEASKDGTVDFKDIIRLKNVQKGQAIAELIDPEPGVPGMAVTGEEIEASLGKKAVFKIGKNIVVAGEPQRLYAAVDGMISITDRDKINVFPMFEINGDVDYRIGNIDFVGTVIVRGNILNGFKVKAHGDIRVIGGIEGAEIEAGGSIDITGGIMASGKGTIAAGNHVRSSFIQDANVTAGGDIIVTQSIMHSNLKAGKNVICSGAKGLIVGGMIQAGESVTARIIGNPMSTATIIEAGVQPQLREEFQELRTALRTLADNLEKTEKALVILDQMAAVGKLTPDRLAMRVKLTATRRQAELDIEEAKERMLIIEKSLENTDASRICVHGTVFGGTKIVIGRYTKFIKDSAQHVIFCYHEGDIAMLPL